MPVREDLHYIKVIKHISNTWVPLKDYQTFRLCLYDQIQACLETFLSTGLRTSVLVVRALPGMSSSFQKQCLPKQFLGTFLLNGCGGHSLQAGLLEPLLLETESSCSALTQAIPVHLDPKSVSGQVHLLEQVWPEELLPET